MHEVGLFCTVRGRYMEYAAREESIATLKGIHVQAGNREIWTMRQQMGLVKLALWSTAA